MSITASEVLMREMNLTAAEAEHFLTGLSLEQRHLILLAQVDPSGDENFKDAVRKTYNQYADGHQTTIAHDPNDSPKLEGLPIPEESKGTTLTTPIPEEDRPTVMGTPIPEQDKNAGILPGSEIKEGDWRDNILTAENVNKGTGNNSIAGELTGVTQNQLDKKFKHAADFGITTTKKNPETLGQYEAAIKSHMGDSATKSQGTYGFVKDSKVFFNSNTNNAVVLDASGNFVTGFKLTPGTSQYDNYMKNGVLR